MCRLTFFVTIVAVALAACSSSPSSTPATTSVSTSISTTSISTTSISTTSVAAAVGEPAGVVTYKGLTQNHVDGVVNYPQSPPVGGDHSPVWQTCQFYDKPIGNVHGVHSMEHGAVWITYQPDLPADQVAVLKPLAGPPAEVLVSPYPGLPAPVVATAWGKQLQLQSATDPRLVQFVKYFENGPQTPEQGAQCDGGTTATT
jgi:hypothetical protein